jgi:hypothetical protein
MRRSDVAAALVERLHTGANNDGGWPYYTGRASRLEPTVWALLALHATQTRSSPDLSKHRRFLDTRQTANGLLLEGTGVPANIGFNGLLALLLSTTPDLLNPESLRRLFFALLQAKGVQLEQHAASRMNNRLQAWPWLDTTFSWVEPTAFCILAFKRSRTDPEARLRIAEAEALLIDRVCAEGGWNFGNADVFGQSLKPYVPTTALALLALQDKRDHPAVAKSFAWLSRNRLAEVSAMALSLVAIALTVYRASADDVIDRLVETWERTSFLKNHHLAAAALYGITAPLHHARAFTLTPHAA